ncbi:MAG: DUF1015 domain-containing protein [Spirochaetes bacterium]|nr:DUF1015 domain-containing protein [Spirochaetota bacterium]
MNETRDRLRALGVEIPEILLPTSKVHLASWAVVACDQYSSEREYWERVAGKVGTRPSTLKLIFPECYLEDGDKAERIGRIQASMSSYLAEGILGSIGRGFVLVERSTPYERSPRLGLMIAVDLEKYGYGADAASLIRPTEGTIVERLPPRMAIRRGAPLELPHIMVLVDDPARSLIEPLYRQRSYLHSLYDFELMEGSGHVRAWKVEGDERFAFLAAGLERLADSAAFATNYGKSDLLLFAVGDGNHSLATAKAVWEEVKAKVKAEGGTPEILENHPARFALVELLNVYDEGLPFHPIHRLLFGVDESELFTELKAAGAELSRKGSAREAFEVCDAAGEAAGEKSGHTVAFTRCGGSGLIHFPKPTQTLAAGTVQAFLDPYLKRHPLTSIDYIHGSGSLETLAAKPGNLGLYLPPVDKASFFRTVIQSGVMPRKTFSMGEAPEKRFYMEARRIVL